MTAKDIVLDQLTGSHWLFEQYTRDFSDEDARFQPFDGGNHLNWMFVHVAVSEDQVLNLLGGRPKRLSEDLHTGYGFASRCKADDGMTRTEAWNIYRQQRERTIEFVRTFPESRYDEKAPEGMPEVFPTVGSLIGMLGTHPFWHFGQLSVNRRMLKKPAIFPAS